MWFYQNNHQFQRQTDNGIIFLQNSAQQLGAKISGKSTTTTPTTKSVQTHQSTINSHTDTITGRWSSRHASIYIDMNNQTLQQAMQEAITAWNNTGAFQFKIVQDKSDADIIATSADNSNDSAAGLTKMSQNTMSGYFTNGYIYLNQAYLLNPEYGYSHERIVNTAEHELGHSIGLAHTNAQSVMQPSGSFYSIQSRDIQAVNKIYGQRPAKPSQTQN